jgi:zinc protease
MKRFAIVPILLIVVALAGAQSVPYTKFTLGNGMTFIFHEDHSVPKVAVNTWFHVGSKDEPERRSGFAHLFEHLMFMGTNRVPGSAFDTIMEGGGGDNNASTTQDRTNFYDTGPSSQLPTLLWLESDRLEDLGKAMTKQKVDLQRQVVLNERREWENSPYGNSEIKMAELLYPVGHPYHFDTIGLPEDLNAASVQDVKNFFATYYVPNNATMVIAGDFDSAKIKPLIEKLFGTLPRQNDPIHRDAGPIDNPSEPLQTVASPDKSGAGIQGPSTTESQRHGDSQSPSAATTRVTYVDQVQFPRITMAWHSPAIYQPGDADMELAGYVLSSGISSRLYQKLIYQDKIATDVSAAQESVKLGSLFEVQVTAKTGVPLEQIEKETREVLADFVQGGPTADELKRQVAQIEYSQVNGLQSIEGIADRLNQYDYYYGEPNSFQRDLDRFRNATPDSVKEAAAQVIGHEPAVIMTVVPKPQTPKANPRDTRPKDYPAASWSPAAPTTLLLSNGLKVFYWQRPQLPLMSVVTVLKRGSELDPAGKEGVADLAAEMLDQGAGGKSATDFSNALDQIGASFSASASVEDTSVSISSTQDNFPQALSLYADALLRPNFEPKEWDRVKQEHLEGILQALDDPSSVARRMGAIEFFGPKNPYGRLTGGTSKSVAAITVDDAKAMHASVYRAEDAIVFASGSMAPDALKDELEKNLGKWPSADGIVPAKPSYATSTKPMRVYVVDKPGAVQTVIRFILPAANGSNYLNLEAIMALFGGTFTSRLNHNLREEKGYTYGAGAGYVREPHADYLVASAAVRTNVTGASLHEFLKEFASIRTGNINADEVGRATGAMRTGRIDTGSSIQGVLGTAVGMYLLGQSYTDVGTELKQISAIKAAKLNQMAKASMPLESGVLILVGDKAEILKQYKGLGLPAPSFVVAQ